MSRGNINKIKKAIIIVLILGGAIAAAIYAITPGCIRTKDQYLVDKWGRRYNVRGIAFTNEVYDNPSLPQTTHHTKESYKELKELGINTIRFYLNYGLFESDEEPYIYRESGFEWLDQNIEWAKENNIKIILNMHYPQGGYQAFEGGSRLWTEEENQKRLTALWGELAKRYKKETTILGYGILNEPIVPQKETFEESLALWSTLAQKLTHTIRNEDNNHIIFVERLQGVIPTLQTAWEFPYQDQRNFIQMEDDNYVYEFHFYNPVEFTHQGLAWYEQQNQGNTASGIKWNSVDAKLGKLDRDYLEKSVEVYLNIGRIKNVPMYIGEMGASNASMQDEIGGEIWLQDMISICEERKVGYTIHSFREEGGFGLYTNQDVQSPAIRNEKMYETLLKSR